MYRRKIKNSNLLKNGVGNPHNKRYNRIVMLIKSENYLEGYQ